MSSDSDLVQIPTLNEVHPICDGQKVDSLAKLSLEDLYTYNDFAT